MSADSLASRYVITAIADGLHQQTRRSAIGALALARSWDEMGYTGITVRGPTGRSLWPGATRDITQMPEGARTEPRR